MPAVNKTANYGLNQWQTNEYPQRQDFVDDNAVIDAQMKANADAAQSAQDAIPGYGSTASQVASTTSGGVEETVSRSDHVHALPDFTTTANTSTESPADGATFTAIDSITTDGKGRVTAKNNKTITLPAILSKVLTGLSTATNAVISATDTILSALGKLQAQVTANLSTLTSHTGLTSTAHGATSAATASTLMARDANGRARVVTPSDPADIALLSTVQKYRWDVIQSYTSAGTYTFTAPDLFGDGRDYEIGVFIQGAGGSGGVAKRVNSSNYFATAVGGAAGYNKISFLTVTPGDEYAVVVGAGGAAVDLDTAEFYHSENGNAGGSSSFNSVSADGGDGGAAAVGNSLTSFLDGAAGGVGSDAVVNDYALPTGSYPDAVTLYTGEAPALGQPSRGISFWSTYWYHVEGGNGYPTMCINPFIGQRILSAGGYATLRVSGGYLVSQPVLTLPDGNSAGAGLAYFGTDDVTADSATSPGCGGGGAANGYTTDPVNTVTSGAGADGAVFIYARGV